MLQTVNDDYSILQNTNDYNSILQNDNSMHNKTNSAQYASRGINTYQAQTTISKGELDGTTAVYTDNPYNNINSFS